MMRIFIMICTIDTGIEKASNVLQEKLKNVSYIVSHQITDEKFKYIPDELNRPDVVVSQISGAGLSRNRNNALKLADGDIALIADDDVTYLPDSFQTILEVFKNDPELDVACFKIKTPKNEAPYKNYPTQSYRLKKRNHHPVSSIEIAFKIKSIKANGILFDERFGLGSAFLPAGEESVFINDCIHKGLKTVYFPYYIVNHPMNSTVNKLSTVDPLRAKLAGAYDAYSAPLFCFPKVFLRTIKYLPDIFRFKKNPFSFLFAGLSGAFIILFSKRS